MDENRGHQGASTTPPPSAPDLPSLHARPSVPCATFRIQTPEELTEQLNSSPSGVLPASPKLTALSPPPGSYRFSTARPPQGHSDPNTARTPPGFSEVSPPVTSYARHQTPQRKGVPRQCTEGEGKIEENEPVISQKRHAGENPHASRRYTLPTVRSRKVTPCSGKELKGEHRRTQPLMTKFDIWMTLQARLKQLWQGHPHHPDCPPRITRLTKVSEWELFTGKLEGEILRKHPNE
ncbi:uncharacterized protein LOC123519716 [Portunus trituberculatus]|uniref:uncharacterized protein LOC123519716 n=1 Tax=Portunus trituberculatus TaxID=210409 RepID=UPI001E1CB6E8|nr:uncharacterized protein LOC123519716 [Portunus trituberculatus]